MTSTLLPIAAPARLNAPTIHRLPTGVTVIAEQLPVDAINLNLWLPVGSALESDQINGMAHFLEHMIFKGTQTLQSGEFEARIEARGALTNAATSQDYTHYYITTAPQDFVDLAPLQLDVLLNPTIPEDGFERERQVVLEEIRRAQDNPRRRSYQHMVEVGFERLPYCRPVLGRAEVIEALQPEQMQAFHRQWYQPEAITAVAVGNLPVEQLIEIVETGFTTVGGGGWGSGDRVLPPVQPAETAFAQVIRREHVDPTLQQARLMLIWRVPGMIAAAQTYALDILASILGDGRTARLVQDLREQRGLVNAITARNMTYRYQGLFCISANLATDNLEAAETAILEHVQRLHQEVVAVAELEKVCTQVANHFVFGNETPSDRANLYGYYHTLMGDIEPALAYPEQVKALTAQELQTAAQQYLPTDAYGVVILKPTA
jgi:predicted Zn-dependent peptidase